MGDWVRADDYAPVGLAWYCNNNSDFNISWHIPQIYFILKFPTCCDHSPDCSPELSIASSIVLGFSGSLSIMRRSSVNCSPDLSQ
jgi:hypothetical protein